MTRKLASYAAVLAAVALAASTATSQTPLLSYDFNETGSTATATGSAASSPDSDLTISGTGATRGGPGSGVTGAAGDLAFDNTNASGFFGVGRAETSGDFDPIDQLSAFTLTGWFQLPDGAESIGRQDSLIEDLDFQVTSPAEEFGGFGLTGGAAANSGALRLRVNSVSGVESGDGTYSEVGEYVFFAVTYDGSEVQFYKGLFDAPASLVSTAPYTQGATTGNEERLLLGVSQGGSSLQSNPFNGLLDNISIYGQVLELGQIEALRSSQAIPEPSSLALAGLMAFAAVGSRRRYGEAVGSLLLRCGSIPTNRTVS